MKALNDSYTIEIGRFDNKKWHAIMQNFEDANLYQTSSYDAARSGRYDYLHLLLRKGNEIVAAVQTRIMQLPVIKAGIAYAFHGPMWRRKGVPEDPEIFRQIIRALRNECSWRQGLVLRLFPKMFRGKDDAVEEILCDEGYRPYDDGKSHRTLIIDLEPALSEIRAALIQRWRTDLNRAEKNGLEMIECDEDTLFDEIKKIQLELAARKGLTELSDVDHLRKVQRNLPGEYKLRVILCRLNGETQAGAIFAAIGNTAEYLVGATSTAGMKSKGSYLIQWRFINWLKEHNFRYFDLNGINPEVNPGVYRFKRRLAGKKGMDLVYLGMFQVADNPLSAPIVIIGESLVAGYKKALRRGRTFKKSINNKLLSK